MVIRVVRILILFSSPFLLRRADVELQCRPGRATFSLQVQQGGSFPNGAQPAGVPSFWFQITVTLSLIHI